MQGFRSLYKISFYLITFLVFIFGGLLQFTLGFSNTILTFFVVGILFLNYLLYVFIVQRVLLSRVVVLSLFYIFLILLTGYIRDSNIILITTYLIFPLLPLSVYFFYHINFKERIVGRGHIFKLFYGIALIQLPVLLIQKNFYETLIPFNNSGQIIEWFDFMFGTFFIKSDHSLGFFIIMVITVILTKNQSLKKPLKHSYLSIGYLSVTLFLTESNISKLFLILLLIASVIIPLYKRYKNTLGFKVTVIALLLIMIGSGISMKNQGFVQRRLGGKLEQQISLERAKRFYEEGTAKRFQIIIVASKELKTKWIGEGPYSYFDIRTGKFKKSPHFSQLIWSYFDLGIIGLVIVLLYLFALIKELDVDKGFPLLFFSGLFLIYSLYTTVFSDITIFLTMFGCFCKQNLVQSA